jgi:hypothetical protein
MKVAFNYAILVVTAHTAKLNLLVYDVRHESFQAASANLPLSAWYPVTVMPTVESFSHSQALQQGWIHRQVLLKGYMSVISKTIYKDSSCMVSALG